MPEPTTSDNQMPSLIPDAGERDSHHRAVRHRPVGSGGGATGTAVWILSLLLLLTLVAGAVGGLWFWEQLQGASVRMTQQDASLEQVRQRLSTTHIDLSAHSKGLAGQLSSLASHQAQLKVQVGEVPGRLSSLDLGQRQLGERQQELASRQQRVAGQQKQLSQRQKRQDQQWKQRAESLAEEAQALREEHNALTVRTEALSEKATRDSGDMSTALTALQDELHGVGKQLQQLSERVASLDRRIELSEEWLEGINAYRREVNERIFRMQQLLVNRVGAEANVPPAADAGLDLQAVMPPQALATPESP